MSKVDPATSSTSLKALELNRGVSLGLGLTNECNLACAFATVIRLAPTVSRSNRSSQLWNAFRFARLAAG
jgi:hypothetical protein